VYGKELVGATDTPDETKAKLKDRLAADRYATGSRETLVAKLQKDLADERAKNVERDTTVKYLEKEALRRQADVEQMRVALADEVKKTTDLIAENTKARQERTKAELDAKTAIESMQRLERQVQDLTAELVRVQQKQRGWKGFIVPGPNCTVTGLVIALKPLADRFGLEGVIMTSMQGLSGAGRSPGVIALDILDNIVPYIPKEEEKQEIEFRKILGTLTGGEIRPHPAIVSATCTRANVADGHTGSVSASLGKKATLEEVRAAWLDYPRRTRWVCRRFPPSTSTSTRTRTARSRSTTATAATA